jgi:hypothetical protein
MSKADPDQSTKSMTVLDPHAMGLRQTVDDDERFSTTHRNELQRFYAVRLRNDSKKCQSGEGKLPTYSKTFSMGYQILDDQLGKACRRAARKPIVETGRKAPTLRDNRGRLSIWTVGSCRQLSVTSKILRREGKGTYRVFGTLNRLPPLGQESLRWTISSLVF